MRAIVILLLAVALAACASEPVQPHGTDGPGPDGSGKGDAGGTWHKGGVQCEPMPWDGSDYGGSDDERIARLLAHYVDEPIDDAEIVDSGMFVATVCGGWTGDWYVVHTTGPFGAAEPDGWTEGEPEA